MNGTPSRTSARTPQAKTPTTAKSSSKRKLSEIGNDENVPTWVMPAIRSVCKAFRIPHAAPNVYVGVSSIGKVIGEQQQAAASTPAKKRARRSAGTESVSGIVSAFDETHIAALIVVVAFFTRSHLLGAPQPDEYTTQRATAIQAVNKAVPEGLLQDEEATISMVEGLLREAENGWLDMEWYHNLPEPDVAAENPGQNANRDTNSVAEDDDEEEDRPVQSLEVPKRGSGSMMTDATDYLSDERRAEYKRWKSGIMKRIAQIEKEAKGKAIAA